MKVAKIIICVLDILAALLFLWFDIRLILKYFNEMPLVNEAEFIFSGIALCILFGIFLVALLVLGVIFAVTDRKLRGMMIAMTAVLVVFCMSPFAAVPIARVIYNNTGYERLNYDDLESTREACSDKISAIATRSGDEYTRGDISAQDDTEKFVAIVSDNDGLTVKIELVYYKNYERLDLVAQADIEAAEGEEYDFSKLEHALEYVNALSTTRFTSEICLDTAYGEEYEQKAWYGYLGQFRKIDKFAYVSTKDTEYYSDDGVCYTELKFRFCSLCKL